MFKRNVQCAVHCLISQQPSQCLCYCQTQCNTLAIPNSFTTSLWHVLYSKRGELLRGVRRKCFFNRKSCLSTSPFCWTDAVTYFSNAQNLFGNLDMFLCHTGSCMTHIRLVRELWRHNFKIKSLKFSRQCSAHDLAADALLEQFGFNHKPRMFWECRRMCASVKCKKCVLRCGIPVVWSQ